MKYTILLLFAGNTSFRVLSKQFNMLLDVSGSVRRVGGTGILLFLVAVALGT